MKITRIGLSMFQIETEEGLVLLTDPWISGNPTTAQEHKTPEYLKRIDALLVSHGHLDHANGIVDIAAVHPDVKTVCHFELGNILASEGLNNVERLNFGGTATIGNVKVSFVPAVHSSTYGKERVYAGQSAGIIVTLESGYRIYYAGDTGLTADMKYVVGDYYKPDLVILPVGGVITMDPDQAVYAAKHLLGASHVIPCHYFPTPEEAPNPEEMAKFIEMVPMIKGMVGNFGKQFEILMSEKYPEIKVTVLGLGESMEISNR